MDIRHRISAILRLYTYIAFAFFLVVIRAKYAATGSPFSAVGTDDFYELVTKDGAFVDKTLIIRDYLSKWKHTVLITRPRLWGKSINTNMIKRFLQIEVNSDGNPLRKKERVNRLLFAGGTTIIEGDEDIELSLKRLKIADCSDIMSHQGRYPVIYINLEGIGATTYRQFLSKLKTKIKDLYNDYGYLKRYMNKIDAKAFYPYAKGIPNEDELEISLLVLSRILCKRYNEPVHILIDEYDAPMRETLVAILRNETTTKRDNSASDTIEKTIKSYDFTRIISFIAYILSHVLKGNKYVGKGLITGVFPMSEDSFRWSLNNVQLYTITHKQFSEFYGFSQEEVDQLLDRYQLTERREFIRRRYKGYNIPENITYNPYSVMRFLQTGVEDNKLSRQIDADLKLVEHLMLHDEFQPKIQDIIIGRNVSDFIDPTRITLDNLVRGELWQYLVHTGYLTPVLEKIKYVTARNKLRAPNNEIRKAFADEALKWASSKIDTENATEVVSNLGKLLGEGKIEHFQKELRKNIAKVTLFRTDIGKKEKAIYRFVLAISIGTSVDDYEIYEHSKQSKGRFSFVMISKEGNNDKAYDTFIFEFGLAHSADELKSTAEEALNRSKQNNNYEGRNYDSVKKVINIGFAFFQNQVELRYETNKR